MVALLKWQVFALKNVLITGTYGGMGRAICIRLLEAGWNVWGLDRREEAPLPGLNFVPCDVTDGASVQAAFQTVSQSVGHLDAIIHTAGIYDLDSLLEIGEERFQRIFEVNLFGVYRINKAFVPLLSPGGRIVIVSSELAPLDPLPFTGLYAVSKGALEKYAASLRMEVNLLGISVTVIRPGAVQTGLLGDSTRALDKFCDKTQLYTCNAQRFKRIVGSVEARNIPPEKVALIAQKALRVRKPKLVYKINRNLLLLLLSALPDRLQVFLIGLILKP